MKKLLAAIVLAAMIAPAHADDGDFFPSGFWEFLDMAKHTWLVTALADYNPNGWNGVWPNSRMVFYLERGGVIKEHVERWQELARSRADVEILGPCYSACTLIVAYVPKERLCFGAFATLQFHLARDRETGKPLLDYSLWMLKQYPREIYDWIMERGGVASMPFRIFGSFEPQICGDGAIVNASVTTRPRNAHPRPSAAADQARLARNAMAKAVWLESPWSYPAT